MPNWIRDSGGRLVKRDTPHNKELELSLKIMEATPEDQHSHHGHQGNPNAFRSMRDRMDPPRMSAPSCIVPPTEQLVIRPHIVPLLPIVKCLKTGLEPPTTWVTLVKTVYKKFTKILI